MPETVLKKLDRKKARLQKKIDKEQDKIKNPSRYKKKQKSYNYGVNNLNTMIEETNVELAKSLKKRELPEELNTVLNSEKDRISKLEVIRKFQDIYKAKDGKEIKEDHQGGEIHPVSKES